MVLALVEWAEGRPEVHDGSKMRRCETCEGGEGRRRGEAVGCCRYRPVKDIRTLRSGYDGIETIDD